MSNSFSSSSSSVEIILRKLVDGGEDLIASVLRDLTGGLFNISSPNSIPSFDLGPIDGLGGKVDGILDKFGLDLTVLTAEFKGYCKKYTP